MIDIIRSEGALGGLRASLLLLVLVSSLGVAVLLAYDRHWGEPWQLLAWLTVVGTLVGLGLLMARSNNKIVWIVRIIAVVTILMSVIGYWRHYEENYTTAPLDHRYTERWETMSPISRWWEVTNGSVGNVPVLVPAAYIPIGLALAAATIGIRGARVDS